MPRAAVLLLAFAVALGGCMTRRVEPGPSLAIQQARAAAAALKARPPARCADPVAMLPSPVVVPFASGEAAISEVGRLALDQAAAWLDCRPAIPVAITGEADPSGAAAIQRGLAARRVQAVRDYLEFRGVAQGRLLAARPATGPVVVVEAKGRGW